MWTAKYCLQVSNIPNIFNVNVFFLKLVKIIIQTLLIDSRTQYSLLPTTDKQTSI